MHQGKLVFSQLMAYLPMSTFRRCVAKHRGEHKVKDFSCLDQFFAMAFAQLTYRESLRDIEVNLGLPLKGQRVLLLGAGGATRGALAPIARAGAARIVIANRTAGKAAALAQEMAPHLPGTVVEGGGFGDLAPGDAFDIVINATAASLAGEAPAVPASAFAAGALAYDMVYGKGLTPFLKLAQAGGTARVADGVGMLVEQAAEAFAWWRGVRPDTRAVLQRLTVPLA